MAIGVGRAALRSLRCRPTVPNDVDKQRGLWGPKETARRLVHAHTRHGVAAREDSTETGRYARGPSGAGRDRTRRCSQRGVA
jgi:hypothetical protein